MDLKEFQSILAIGETVAVEFKRCGNGIDSDTYETVCSFLNRFGGDIFMGVLDDGSVIGVPEKAAPDMVKNFIAVISNPALFSPTVYLVPEVIVDESGRHIIHVHVPPSAEVHSYKKVIYDRVDDADVKVTATSQLAAMYIRKQTIFTEKKIFPYATMDDLRLDLLPKIRIMAQNHAGGQHPWTSMDDMTLLKSAGLYGRDIATGQEGFNLAAIMLLGKDDVILNVAPSYVTDALVRKVNTTRYDDREIIKTNLIESYEQLLAFGRKHLPDKFFLEDTVNISLRNVIVREMVSNTLMHREFTSSYTAKFVIEKDQMYVENANRALKEGYITLDNLEPNSKNPIIAAFFRNIGYADQLGSGVKKLFEYSKYYSGKAPEFIEGDIFRILVPLDDSYSYESGQTGISNQSNQSNQSDQTNLSEAERTLLEWIKTYPDMSIVLIAKELDWSESRVKYYIQKLKQANKIKKNWHWAKRSLDDSWKGGWLMDAFMESDDKRLTIKNKLREYFDGKIVRKDLTKHIKEGANVPVYVLEFLLGQYCSSDDEEIIEEGVNNVKRILADNFVRPDEAQKVLSILRERGSYTVIDKITVRLNIKEDRYEAEFSNLGIKNIPISSDYPSKFDRLLCGGIWCILQLDYEFIEEDKKNASPIHIRKLTPIQMPHIDMDELKAARGVFTKEEWIDVLIRSTGMEPDKLSERVKWLLLARMIPLVENNFNLCELGPRSTGKSHIYKEISPNSILVSGGQTTVANLFYNMASKTVGLVGMWDVVAFDEVAGITFKDKDGVQIMKDYMASGSFARGREEKAASASMVFVGNINQSVDVLLKTSHLFEPFPAAMAYDTAFLDRMHCYVPGWEIPKYRPDFFTDDYGFITDYLAEYMREMRKASFGDAFDKYFRLGSNLNQRDTIAVRKMVSGFMKLVYPDGNYTKENVEEILTLALELRRRVKEQLKKIGGMEFYDVNFSYIDNETFEERYVPVPEQGAGKLIPEGLANPGQVYTVSRGKTGMIGVYRLETQVLPGNGKFERTGIGTDREAKEATNTAFNFLKANSNSISGAISTTTKDYIINYQDLNGLGITNRLALPTLIAICSAALNKPTLSGVVVLGEISISGTLMKVEELANVLQVCLDSGAKKVLLPITSAADLGTVPAELVGAFSLIFYATPQEAVFKALGVE